MSRSNFWGTHSFTSTRTWSRTATACGHARWIDLPFLLHSTRNKPSCSSQTHLLPHFSKPTIHSVTHSTKANCFPNSTWTNPRRTLEAHTLSLARSRFGKKHSLCWRQAKTHDSRDLSTEAKVFHRHCAKFCIFTCWQSAAAACRPADCNLSTTESLWFRSRFANALTTSKKPPNHFSLQRQHRNKPSQM